MERARRGPSLNYSFLPLTPPQPFTPPPEIKNKLEDLYAEALNVFKEKCGEKMREVWAERTPPCAGAARKPKIQRCANRDLGTRQEALVCERKDSCS